MNALPEFILTPGLCELDVLATRVKSRSADTLSFICQ
jgi:hypothetical protein